MEELGQQLDSRLKMMDEQIQAIKEIATDMGELIDIIETIPEHIAEIKNLVKSHFRMISNKVTMYEFDSMKMKLMIKHQMIEKVDMSFVLEKTDIPSTSSGDHVMENAPDTEEEVREKFSFKPQSDKTTTFGKIPQQIPPQQQPFLLDPVARQRNKMIELYSLAQTESRYVDFTGVYPRLNYLQGSPADEIRYWYDFGAINMIYLTSPDFPELSDLPRWVITSVKNCYQNNPTMTPRDTLALKFLSAGPDFFNDYYYPAYHFIHLEKCQAFSCKIDSKRKEFTNFNENDIHYRRAIGIRVVIQGMESTLKKPFRTYGGEYKNSPVMIAPARKSPDAAIKFLNSKINLLETGSVRSSPEAQYKICQYRKHPPGTCPSCSPNKTNMSTNSSRDSLNSNE